MKFIWRCVRRLAKLRASNRGITRLQECWPSLERPTRGITRLQECWPSLERPTRGITRLQAYEPSLERPTHDIERLQARWPSLEAPKSRYYAAASMVTKLAGFRCLDYVTFESLY
ncbi:hypothetical protein [Cohnella sp.]|uniref:hypothetical protein n=1 Tax=Cohnella sp. TaxID=1883426 RepID=UPI0037048A8D